METNDAVRHRYYTFVCCQNKLQCDGCRGQYEYNGEVNCCECSCHNEVQKMDKEGK